MIKSLLPQADDAALNAHKTCLMRVRFAHKICPNRIKFAHKIFLDDALT